MYALPVGIVVWDANGSVHDSNPRAAEMVGRPILRGLTAAEACSAWRLFHAGTNRVYPPELAVLPALFRGQVTAFRDAEFEHPNGGRCAVEGWTTPVRDDVGGVSHAVTTLIDVTESRRADALGAAAIRVLEMVATDEPLEPTLETLARLFEAQADGMLASVLLVEDDSRVRHVAAPSLPDGWIRRIDGEPIGPNRGSCGTAAFLREPVVVADIASDARWALYRDAALALGLRACWSTPILGHDGTVLGTFAFYYTERREPTPRLLNLASRASDLATVAIQHSLHKAAAKRAELELRTRQQSELSERLALATRSARIGIWCWYVRENRIEWDEQVKRLYGGVSTEFSGTYDAWRDRVHPDDLARVEQAVKAALGGEADFDTEFRVLWADGSARHIKVNAVVQRAPDGSPERVIGTNWDITDEKRAEEALMAARDAAESATRAKSLFLAHMSHEIRTPMNAILGYAQLLRRDRGLGETQRQYVDVIHSSGNHLLTLINDILEMSKIEAGRTTLSIKPFDLHALLEELRSMFAALVAEKGLELSFALAPGLVRVVDGDAVKVRQVVINLLSNAIKFTERGRIGVTASSQPAREGVLALRIAVEDTGAGIPGGDLTRIFEPFDRSSSGPQTSGTGLGLSISANFARLMNGELRVESVLGRGSSFVFSFEVGVVPEASAELGVSERVTADSPPLSEANAWRDIAAAADELAALARDLPPELVVELRDAALQARAGRIASLALRAREHSAAAAARIEELAGGFRYDALLAALEAKGET